MVEHMFGSVVDPVPAVGGPVLRVPFAALAARPVGLEAALLTEQLATVLTAATGTGADPAAGTDPVVSSDPPGEAPAEAVAVERDLVDLITAAERVRARAEAAQVLAVAELATRPMFAGCTDHGHGDPGHGVRGAASVISAELRLSPTAAVQRVAVACELVDSLPATLAALAAGRIDGYRARIIAEQTRPPRFGTRVAPVGRGNAAGDGAAANHHPTAVNGPEGGAGGGSGERRGAPSAGAGRPVRVPAVSRTRRHGQPADPAARRRRRRRLHRRRPPSATSRKPPTRVMGGRWISCALTWWPGWAGRRWPAGIWAAATPHAAMCSSGSVPGGVGWRRST
jgi:hypothetical protein